MYTEEKIAEIEKNILSGIEQEQQQLKDIEDLSWSITEKLIQTNNVRENIFGTDVVIKYIQYTDSTTGYKMITVLIADPVKYMLAPNRYTPAKATAEYNDEYSFKENLFAAIKGYVSNKAGIIQLEEN